MKWNTGKLVLLVLLGAAVALIIAGCAEQPEVTTETVDEIPEAAEEVYTDEPEEPGQEEAPGLEVEEMVDDTPPHVEGEETGDEAGDGDEMPQPAPDADADM